MLRHNSLQGYTAIWNFSLTFLHISNVISVWSIHIDKKLYITCVVVYSFKLLQCLKKPNGGKTPLNKRKYICSCISYQAAVLPSKLLQSPDPNKPWCSDLAWHTLSTRSSVWKRKQNKKTTEVSSWILVNPVTPTPHIITVPIVKLVPSA